MAGGGLTMRKGVSVMAGEEVTCGWGHDEKGEGGVSPSLGSSGGEPDTAASAHLPRQERSLEMRGKTE